MFRQKPVIGIIPAKGKSKRLPGKNLIFAAGKSLLEWTIEEGVKSKFIDRLILSTEDEGVADVGRRFSVCEVLTRPVSLAGDDTPMTAVICQVLDILAGRGENYGYFILLQPTSLLRTSKHIEEAFTLIEKTDAAGAISVCLTEHPLEWMGKLSPNGFLDTFFRKTELDKQSQAFSSSYQVNGAIYITPVDRFLEEKTLFLSSRMVAYVMDRKDSVDIDDEYDLRLSEWLLTQREQKYPLD